MKSLKGPIPAAAEPAVVPEPAAPGSVAAAILEACTKQNPVLWQAGWPTNFGRRLKF